MSKKYSASVIGAGLGGGLSMTGLSNSSRYNLVAVADTRADALAKVKKQYPNIQTFTSHKEMFAKCPTDVVCVSTYAPSHLGITEDALKTKLRGILVEKPLSEKAISGLKLIELIKKKNLPMVVPHNLLVADHSVEILKLVHTGKIGDLKLVEIECNGWDIFNAGIHWINFFAALTKNEPIASVITSADKSTKTYRDGVNVETMAVTYLWTKSGVRCVLNTGDYVNISKDGKGLLFRLIGTKGFIEFYGWENGYNILNSKYPNGKFFIAKGDKRTGHQRHLENLAKMIDAGKPDYTVANSSLMALEVCEAAYLSAMNSCEVKFPLSGFKVPKKNSWNLGKPYNAKNGGRDGRNLPQAN